MARPDFVCPKCNAALRLRQSPDEGKLIRCPRCKEAVPFHQPTSPPATPTEPREKEQHAITEYEDVTARARKESASLPQAPPRKSSGLVWVLVALCVLLLGGGAVAFFVLRSTDDNNTASKPQPDSGPSDPFLLNTNANQPVAKKKETPPFEPPLLTARSLSVPQPTVPVSLPVLEEKPRLVLDSGGHTSAVKQVLFTPDGKSLVTVSLDKTIRVISVATGRTERVLRLAVGPGSEGILHAAALSPDGNLLAVAGRPFGGGKLGMPIHLIDFESGQVLRLLQGHDNVITTLDFSASGKLLASANAGGALLLHSVETGELKGRYVGHRDSIYQVLFHPTDKILATCSRDTTIVLWDMTKAPLEPKRLPKHTTKPVVSLAWSHDGTKLASGGVDGTVRLWTPEGNYIQSVFTQVVSSRQSGRKIPAQVVTLHFTPDDRELVFGGIAFRGTIGIYNLPDDKLRLNLHHHNNTVQTGDVSPDGKLVVTSGGDDNETILWSTVDGAIVHDIRGQGKSVLAVGWHPEGNKIAWANINRVTPNAKARPLEQAFDLEQLASIPYDRETNYRQDVHEQGPYELVAEHFFNIHFKKDNEIYFDFKSPHTKERIYSFSLFGPNRAIIGGAYGLYQVDLFTGRIVRQHRGHSGIVWAIAPHPNGRYFMTSSSDQTIAIWSPDSDRPLMTFFVAGQHWICWTPEGYYAASPYGERLMGWQVNRGIEKMASFYSAVQFRKSLYQPKVMKTLLQAGSLRQALVQAGIDAEGDALSIVEVLPPKVSLLAPAEQGRVNIEKETFQVQATAESVGEHPVTSLRLLVNGRPYLGERGVVSLAEPKPGKVEATWDVQLPPGEHTLAVQATSKVSKGLSALVEVLREGKVPKPNLYVLACGVSDYPGAGKLDYAASDAELLTQTLREQARDLFDSIEVHLITDAKATKQGMVDGLDWIQSKMTTKDVAIVFFSGHGCHDERGGFVMIPIDARSDDLEGSCLTGRRLKETLENLPGRVVAMLDCCHAGAAVDPKQNTPRVADDLVRDLLTDDYGVIVMCGSTGFGFSLESPVVKAGFFTRGLVVGMKGQADSNRDNVIHIHELDLFTRDFVRRLTAGRQTPVTGLPRHTRSFPIAKRPSQ